jgi:hypothetical protein
MVRRPQDLYAKPKGLCVQQVFLGHQCLGGNHLGGWFCQSPGLGNRAEGNRSGQHTLIY